jgi:hypothetical protein
MRGSCAAEQWVHTARRLFAGLGLLTRPRTIQAWLLGRDEPIPLNPFAEFMRSAGYLVNAADADRAQLELEPVPVSASGMPHAVGEPTGEARWDYAQTS